MTDDLGWWSVSGEVLMEMLQRCAAGESPGIVYAEMYANSDHKYVEAEDDGPSPAL